jgi:hypothetical protein
VCVDGVIYIAMRVGWVLGPKVLWGRSLRARAKKESFLPPSSRGTHLPPPFKKTPINNTHASLRPAGLPPLRAVAARVGVFCASF